MGSGTADESQPGGFSGLLCRVTRSIIERPGLTILLVLLTAVLSLVVTARFLTFKTNRADLIDPRADFQQRWLHYVDRFGEQSDIVLLLECADEARLKEAMDAIGAKLTAESDLFRNVHWKLDIRSLQSKGLQYLSPQQLEQGLQRLEEYGPVLSGHWNRVGLESYCRRLAGHIRWTRENGRTQEEAATVAQAVQLCRSLVQFLGSMSAEGTATAAGQPVFVSPWPEVFAGAADSLGMMSEVRYQLSDDRQLGFVVVAPASATTDFAGTSAPLARMRELVAEARETFPEITWGLTGIPVLECDEMERSQVDMSRATLLSFAGVALVLLIGFRGLKHPLLALLMLVVGLAWTLGYTTFVVGHLNILSVSFAAILTGLGIDYAIHYMARYLELRHEGLPLEKSLLQTSRTVGTGIVAAAVTTSLAFLCAAFTQFLGVAELGLIAGGGILLCAGAAFVVLPALVRMADGKTEPRRLPIPFQGTLLRAVTSRYPWFVTFSSVALIAVLSAPAFDWSDGQLQFLVGYDSNLLNLQADDVDSVKVQQKIFDHSSGSLLYAVSLVEGPAEARAAAERFRKLESVSHVEHLGDLVPRFPREETSLLVQAIRSRLSHLSDFPRELPAVDPLAVGLSLEELLSVLQSSPAPEAREAAAGLDHLLTAFERAPLEQQYAALGGYQYAMLTALRVQFERIADAADPEPPTPADLPPGLRERFVSPQGDWLLQIYPREQIWEDAPLATFVEEVRSVDPEVTGTPLQNYEAARQIRESYLNASLYAFLAICLVLLVDALDSGPMWVSLLAPVIVVVFALVSWMRPDESLDLRWMLALYVGLAVAVGAVFDFANVRNMVLSLMPPVLGLAMMFGVLAWLGIDLNPANIIVLPLILGIGVDDGVHMLHDFRHQQGRYSISSSTINAVIMTSLTSMAGFGSMIGSSHRGLSSLGLVLVIGVTTSLFVSLVALPPVLTLISRRWPSRLQAELPADLDPEELSRHLLPLRPEVCTVSPPSTVLRRATGS